MVIKTLAWPRGYSLLKYFKRVLNNWLIQFQILPQAFIPYIPGNHFWVVHLSLASLVFSFSILPFSLLSHSPTGNWVIYTNYLFPLSTDPRNMSCIANFLPRRMYSVDSRMRMSEPVGRSGGFSYTLLFLWGSRLTVHRIMGNKTKYNTTHWPFT